MRNCEACSNPISAQRRTKRFCSTKCQMQKYRQQPEERACKLCKRVFIHKGRDGNRRHCSDECSRESARLSRAAFRERSPDRLQVYRETARAKNKRDTVLVRLLRKYPSLPKECEACGESRVLDVAHRPEHRRNGAWGRMSNRTPEKIWILCPTCHALLDRLGYTAEQLGIKPRTAVAA